LLEPFLTLSNCNKSNLARISRHVANCKCWLWWAWSW